MSLFDGLKLVELVKDGEIRTYLANDPQRSRNLLVHWMPASGSVEVHSLLEMLDHLPPTARALILETGVRHDRMYVITENPTKFSGLQEWLREAAKQKSAEVTDPMQRPGQWQAQSATPQLVPTLEVRRPLVATPTPAAPPEPGEFTRMFAGTPNAPPTPPQLAAPKEPQEPGEFTRLFSAPEQTTSPPASPQMPAPKPQSIEPGEFTRMFMSTGSGSPVAPPPPIPPKPVSSAPGEFTRMFQGQRGAGMPPTAPPQKTDPGEFTKFFQSPLVTPSAATPSDDYFLKPSAQARSTPEVGEFTKIFGKPATTEPVAGTTTPSVASTSGPSEYTRMMSAQPVAPAPASVPAPTPAAEKRSAAPKSKSVLPLILILAFLAALALVLVFVFVRSH